MTEPNILPVVLNDYTRIFEFVDPDGKKYIQVAVASPDYIKESTWKFFEDNFWTRISISENAGWITAIYKKYYED